MTALWSGRELNVKPGLAYNRPTMNGNPYFNLFDYFLSDERLKDIGWRTAIEFRDHAYTYDELREGVERWVAELSGREVKEGDRVAFWLYDSPEFIAGFLAAAYLGAICVPINTFLNQTEVAFILKDANAKLLIVDRELAAPFFQPGPDNDGEYVISLLQTGEAEGMPFALGLAFGDPNKVSCSAGLLTKGRNRSTLEGETLRSFGSQKAKGSPLAKAFTTRETPVLLLYTSGSTGTPKGALHAQGNVVATIEGFGDQVLQFQPSDKIFSASRLYFAYGFGNSLSFPLAAGATVILEKDRPTPTLIAGILGERKPTVFFAVPAVFRALLDLQAKNSRVDTTSLRMCVSAGEALPASIFEEWKSVFGLSILDGIGSTEMLHMFLSNRQGEARAGSSGREVPGYEAKIIDGEGQKIAPGEQGNLWVKGASAMLGYWQRQDLTAAVSRDGWIKTGDVYRQDEDGYYYHIGRSDDCFKVKGLWVSPIEIEMVLSAHPEVAEAAVVVSTDEKGLATAKAYLVIRNDRETLKDELFEFAKARLPLYKTPTQFEFVIQMPRTSTGKIQRFKLRESK